MTRPLAVHEMPVSWQGLGKIVQTYGVLGAAVLGLNLLRTRLWYPRARLIRYPIHIRGRQYIDFGMRLTAGRGCRIDAFSSKPGRKNLIEFGKDVQINDCVHIAAIESVRIHDHVLIASRVFISDHNHGVYSGSGAHSHPGIPPAERPLGSTPVVIEENVWIGEGASILAGVTIGRGTIIGAQAMVNRSIPPFSLAAGTPARVLKTYDFATERWVRV